jgi:ABC-type Fe3+-hydroxamate transport system substrate-binding protein
MTRTRVPLARAAALLAAGALALAGCGTTEPTEPAGTGDNDDAATSSAAAGPVTYTDERGEHTLDAPAQDVVALEWGLTENLLALGVEPIGQADVEGYNTWATAAPLDPETEDVGMRGEPSLSAITALEPDLIVTTTDVPANVIDQLEEIAPVLAVRGSNSEDPLGYMRQTVETLAVATGTEDRAEQLLADFDAKLEEGRQAIKDAGLEGEPFTMADGWLAGGTVSIRMYTPGSFFGAIGEELGMVNAWTEGGDPDYGLAQTDVEGLTEIGPAQFFYIANDTQGGDAFTEGLGDNPIWQQLPFVEDGTVHRLPDGIWMFGGPLSAAAYIDAIIEAVGS